MSDFGGSEETKPIVIAVIGDSSSDLDLSKNLALVDAKTSVDVHTLIATPGKESSTKTVFPIKSVKMCSSWTELEEQAVELLNSINKSEALHYLLLDIDRTCILPRGLADDDLERARIVAVNNFVRMVLRDEEADLANIILTSYQLAASFPPYVDTSSVYSADEDVRVLCTLLLTCGVFRKEDWGEDRGEIRKPADLMEWIDLGLERSEKMELKVGNRRLIHESLGEIKRRVTARVSSFLLDYRDEEEKALLDIQKQGRFTINGHIVRLVSKVALQGWIPLGYSDRPGASLGLKLDTDFRSRPRWIPTALIECQAPLAFEEL
jgi:hypothetical protein